MSTAAESADDIAHCRWCFRHCWERPIYNDLVKKLPDAVALRWYRTRVGKWGLDELCLHLVRSMLVGCDRIARRVDGNRVLAVGWLHVSVKLLFSEVEWLEVLMERLFSEDGTVVF